MLNEEIRSAFRLKAYLQRRLDRSAEILQTDHNRWLWLLENRRLIFAEELRSGQDRLLTKLRNLSLQQHGIQLNCSRTHTYKRINWLVNNLLQDTSVHKMHHLSAKPVLDHKTEPVTFDTSVFSEYVSSDSNATRSGRDSWLKITRARLWFLSQSFMYSVRYRIQTILSRLISSFCKYSRVFRECTDSSVDKPPRKIISPDLPTTAADSHHAFQLPQTQPRLVNLSQRVIHPSTKDVLEKGPKFCLSQKITSKIMNSAEVGIERAFYAMKWAAHLEDRRANTTPADEDCAPISDTDSSQASQTVSVPHPRPNFPDSDVQQPPEVDPSAERKLEQLKSKILKLFTHHKVQEKPNIPSSVLMDLRELKKDDSLIIKQSDKCKSFVLMDKEEYVA